MTLSGSLMQSVSSQTWTVSMTADECNPNNSLIGYIDGSGSSSSPLSLARREDPRFNSISLER